MMERKIVLLIDAENTSARYAKRIVDYLEKRGDIICARIYGDFINNVSVKGWNSVAIEYEMEQKQQLTTSAGKNSSDIALVIDAMDLLYQKNIDTLCIVTSDGDFTGLVKRIREDGIEVIGIGKADASKRLEKVCDQYLDFEELAKERITKAGAEGIKNPNKKIEKKLEKKQGRKSNEIPQNAKNSGNTMKVGTKKLVWGDGQKEGKTQTNLKNEKKKGKNSQLKGGALDRGDKKTVQANREKLGEIKKAIHEMVQREEKNGKYAELGGVKSQLQLKYPGFDEKEFGYKSIRDLINKETKFQVVLEGRHTYVVPEKMVRKEEVSDRMDSAQNVPAENVQEEAKTKKKKGFSIKGLMPKKKA